MFSLPTYKRPEKLKNFIESYKRTGATAPVEVIIQGDHSLYDGIEYRGYGQVIVEELAKHAGVPVWNGLTNEFHPTDSFQILMNRFLLAEKSLTEKSKPDHFLDRL